MNEGKPRHDPVVWREENERITYVPTADGLFEKWLESADPNLIECGFSGDVEWARAVWAAAKSAYQDKQGQSE